MRKIPLALIAALALIGIGFYALRPPIEAPHARAPQAAATVPEGATIVTLTQDGFVPSEITVAKGTTVAFVTENGKIFWPASNLHPSHALYPEFDPLQPIQPDEAWSFTFDKPGSWRYHDHLAPYYTGTITVTE